jgi:hypothetical protein
MILVGKPGAIDLKYLGVIGRIILKWILRKWGWGRMWTGLM